MEWISQWFDKITESVVWKTVLSRAQWIDWLVLILLIIGLFKGAKKGFMSMLGGILQLIAVIALTLEFYPKASSFLLTYLDFLPHAWIQVIGFAIAGAILWWMVAFVCEFLGKIITAQTSEQLKVFGGAIGGVAYTFFLLSFLSQGVLLSPLDSIKKVYDKNASYAGYQLAHLAPKIHQLVIHPLQTSGLAPKKPE
ncbi:MAG TPA: CvpA family protein [bacterium]|nr:CvpA family protein [bacterium]